MRPGVDVIAEGLPKIKGPAARPQQFGRARAIPRSGLSPHCGNRTGSCSSRNRTGLAAGVSAKGWSQPLCAGVDVIAAGCAENKMDPVPRPQRFGRARAVRRYRPLAVVRQPHGQLLFAQPQALFAHPQEQVPHSQAPQQFVFAAFSTLVFFKFVMLFCPFHFRSASSAFKGADERPPKTLQ